jgi:hypothetical protein
MPLLIDRVPFSCWSDSTQTPPLAHWTIVLPIVLTRNVSERSSTRPGCKGES